MRFLERVSPAYQEVILPLCKWKILSTDELRKLSEYKNGRHAFYKIVRKLENYCLVDSYIDVWTNEKFIYLTDDGINALGDECDFSTVNRVTRFHDALAIKISRQISQHPYCYKVVPDYQIIKEVKKNLKHLPDAIITFNNHRFFSISLEIELTQKSRKRVEEIFEYHLTNRVADKILYLFNKESVFEAYKEVQSIMRSDGYQGMENLILVYCPELTKRGFNILEQEIEVGYRREKFKEYLNYEMSLA